MDRLDTFALFVAVAEQGSFIGAARRLGRSAAAASRAVAALEARLGTRLFNRTTRAVALTDAGARYLEICRRLLADLGELEAMAASERVEPAGRLSLSAPVLFGRLHVLPVVCGFLREFPALDVGLLLVDRVVSLVDEGMDLGVRLGDLPDSSLRAIGAGSVRRTLYASPAYLAARGAPRTPPDLAAHACISFSALTPVADRWTFAAAAAGAAAVGVRPCLVVNTAEAAVDAACAGLGITRVLSYQAEAAMAAGRLREVLLAGYPPPRVPIQVVHPAGRHLPAKVRLFIDRVVEALRARFEGGAAPGRPLPS